MASEKVLCVIFLLSNLLYCAEPLGLKEFAAIKKTHKNLIISGKPLVIGEVKTLNNNKQSLNYLAAMRHKKDCNFALRKLSRYEKFSEYIDFIKESHYDEAKQRLEFLVDHVLMPFKIRVDFKLERITGVGIYHFEFDKGFLLGLKGEIHVNEIKIKRKSYCLFSGKANWTGPHTKINSTIFQVFIETLSKIGMDRLVKISSY